MSSYGQDYKAAAIPEQKLSLQKELRIEICVAVITKKWRSNYWREYLAKASFNVRSGSKEGHSVGFVATDGKFYTFYIVHCSIMIQKTNKMHNQCIYIYFFSQINSLTCFSHFWPLSGCSLLQITVIQQYEHSSKIKLLTNVIQNATIVLYISICN